MHINLKHKMGRAIIFIFILMSLPAFGDSGHGALRDGILDAVSGYMPGVTRFGRVEVGPVAIDDSARRVDVALSEAATYIPFTAKSLSMFKSDIAGLLPESKRGYGINVTGGGKSLDSLALFAPKDFRGPDGSDGRFFRDMGAEVSSDGLDGAVIAMWQSHGWYYERKFDRWEWQRARIFQTVEDLYTQSYVMPFLMPMLRNAGAYVMSPRERDVSNVEIIIDGDGGRNVQGHYRERNGRHKWREAGGIAGFAYTKKELREGDNPFREGGVRKVSVAMPGERESTSGWYADIPATGEYAVYVSYASLPESSPQVRYRVNSMSGSRDFIINQQMGGGTWIYLGHFQFEAGGRDMPLVEVSNIAPDGSCAGCVVTADAVKIGGGMGNVARGVMDAGDCIVHRYSVSGLPRFTEGARYWLQWAGMPDSVYTPSGNGNDYTDDYRCRALWVNHMAGGSSVMPSRKGLKIPVDLSLAFHTDAGTTMNDSVIGTLGIYCTIGDTLGNGSSRLASRDLTDLVMTSIVNDIRAVWNPSWTRRGMWDKSYFEARAPEVPAMLLELLSHQNFADMKHGLDPAFRFDVSRAIYKGILRFIAARDGRPYVVQPLPVRAFAISRTYGGDGMYELSWKPSVDSLEATAVPTHYIIEERVDSGAFMVAGRSAEPRFSISVRDGKIHSYRIIAVNSGGVSFPSEVLAMCHKPGGTPVVIVNGFTRVSAPDWFDHGDIAGFYDSKDHGVPYMEDISYIGSQYEFRRKVPWMDDDAAGFGASRSDYQDKVLAGNTFDYTYTHGRAVADAGYGFVSLSVDAFVESPLPGVPAVIDLILGKQRQTAVGTGLKSRFKAFTPGLKAKLKECTDNGCSVFVSGSYVASDIWDNPYSDSLTMVSDKDFAAGVLGYKWRVGQATVTGSVCGLLSPSGLFDGESYTFNQMLDTRCYPVESPDAIYPSDLYRGIPVMKYTENNLTAAVAHDAGDYRTVVMGFPFESVVGVRAKASLMRCVLEYLCPKQVKNN